MKRYGNLYPQIVEFENLLKAAKKAQKGKRFRDNVLEFNYNLEKELIQLQQELQSQTYQPGDYRTFHIRDPKNWFQQALTSSGIILFPLTPEIATRAVSLSPVHKDPFDRIIIATALVYQANLASIDSLFSQYLELAPFLMK